ncbi:MAG: RecX family transcriptional regulator [Christensenellaceae bacterium]|nr:RecX family transcriptional regulator [Christensenellaceae bacterium]
MKKILLIRKAKIYIHVELDDGAKLVLKEDTVAKHMLYKGMMLDDEKITEILSNDGKQRALEKAANYLGYGMKTTKQVKDKLKEKGADEESIDYAIEKLSEYCYIDDSEYARLYAQQNAKKYGVKMIENKLRQTGVCANIAKEAAKSVSDSQEEAAKALLEKLSRKYAGLDERKKKQKMYEALMRKGFEWGKVSHLLKVDYDDGFEE